MFIQQHVSCLLSCIGLIHIQDSVVNQLSGGERKRLSIAIQLVSSPSALVLDEPTSGLDASSSLAMFRVLKAISVIGITVICVIHQPREDIFQILDDVLLLSSGRQAFLGRAADAHVYFMSLGHRIPHHKNMADALLDIISSDSFPAFNAVVRQLTRLENNSDSEADERMKIISSHVMSRRTIWYRQLSLCIFREMKQQLRRYTIFTTELIVSAVSGLMIGLAVYSFDGNLFHGIFKHPFEPLSSSVDYTMVTQLALLSTLAMSMFRTGLSLLKIHPI